jgi:hypothetical protein
MSESIRSLYDLYANDVYRFAKLTLGDAERSERCYARSLLSGIQIDEQFSGRIEFPDLDHEHSPQLHL